MTRTPTDSASGFPASPLSRLAVAFLGSFPDPGVRLDPVLPEIAFVGRSNVGKSSLLNALVRESRAIVTPIPGTTRDLIEETINIRGIPVRTIDTAGIRQTSSVVEKAGIDRTRRTIEQADLILAMLDASKGLSKAEKDFLLTLSPTPPPAGLTLTPDPSPSEGRGGTNSPLPSEGEGSGVRVSGRKPRSRMAPSTRRIMVNTRSSVI
jgi:hypothetical protein